MHRKICSRSSWPNAPNCSTRRFITLFLIAWKYYSDQAQHFQHRRNYYSEGNRRRNLVRVDFLGGRSGLAAHRQSHPAGDQKVQFRRRYAARTSRPRTSRGCEYAASSKCSISRDRGLDFCAAPDRRSLCAQRSARAFVKVAIGHFC